MAYYAYIRVSTNLQDTDSQRFEVMKYCDTKKITITEWVSETASGSIHFKKRLLGALIEKVQASDWVICPELSRISRSIYATMEILSILMQKKVHVHCIKENMDIGDDLNSSILAFAFGVSSQIERNLISQRTRESMQKMKAEGRKLGRPKGVNGKSRLDEKRDLIVDFLSKGVSKSSICKITGVTAPTLDSFLITRKIKVEKK